MTVAAACKLCEVGEVEVEEDQGRGVECKDAGSEGDSCGSWVLGNGGSLVGHMRRCCVRWSGERG